MPELITRKDKMDKQRAMMAKIGPQLRAACAAIPAEYFAQTWLTACMKTPGLLDCDPLSIIQANLIAAQYALPIDGRMSAVVPFKNKATWMPMYQGLVQLAYRSNIVVGIHTAEVRENDSFEYWEGEWPRHRKHSPAKEAGKVVGAWAGIRIKGGGHVVEYLDMDRINAIKRLSRGASRSDSPWSDMDDIDSNGRVTRLGQGFMWMARKSALKQALKESPQDTRLTGALQRDDAAASGAPVEIPIVDLGEAVVTEGGAMTDAEKKAIEGGE